MMLEGVRSSIFFYILGGPKPRIWLSNPLTPFPSPAASLNSNRETSLSTQHSDQPSKAASIHLARTLANQLADKFILVNAICPGTFPSGMTAHGLKNNSELIHEGQPTGEWGFVSVSLSCFLSRESPTEDRSLFSSNVLFITCNCDFGLHLTLLHF